MKDFSSPVDPRSDARLSEALRQLKIEPGPLVPERTSRDNAAKIEAVWQALTVRAVDAVAEPSRRSGRVQRGITTSRSWIGIATVVLCVIGVTATLMYRTGSTPRTTHYQTTGGQVSRVSLPNGTVMTLAPATSVTVSGTRGAATVDVDGEVYFTIVQSSKHPFVVRTSNTVVQVLGTAFSVRRYANETRTRVVVEDGKVAVRAKRHEDVDDVPTTMTARMIAQVSDSGVLVRSGIDPRIYTGLTTGSLIFTEVPLEKVVAELSRAYGADIRVADSSLGKRVITMTAAFARQPLSQVLEILVRISGAHVTRAGDAFVVVPGRTPTPAEPLQQDRHFPQSEKSYGR